MIPVTLLTYAACQHLDNLQKQLRAWADYHRVCGLQGHTPELRLWHSLLEWICRLVAGALAGFLAGYLSHVLLDLSTPRSLPMFC